MFFDRKAGWDNNNMLLDDSGRTVTYGEFYTFAEKIGTKMKKRSLMFLLCENSSGSVLTYLSALQNNIVPLLLDSNIDESKLYTLMELYRPEYLACPEKWEEKMGEQCGNLNIIWRSNGYICFAFLHNQAGTEEEIYEDLALLLTTSGSTGSPKLVRLSRKNIESNAASISVYLNLDRKEKPVTTLPMYYTYGLSIINSHILVGACILLTDKTLFEKEFWDFVRKNKATSFGGVPYTYQMLKRLNFFEIELPFLKTMTQAGGKLPETLHQEFAAYAKQNNKNFVVMYGQTEATARMGYLPSEYALKKCGSMGIAIPGGRFYLIDENGEKITEANVVGNLVYEGANVSLGYARSREDLKKGDERRGVLVTGDLAKRDEEGFYYIAGRKKRFLKMYGIRVSMDEIEQLLKMSFQKVDFACTGKDDCMVVSVAGMKAEEMMELSAWLEEKTGLNSRGFVINPVSEIPRNKSGKILYNQLCD